ncbi:HK97 family phage major capsid protein [Bradyrhizobium sp. S3.3.6]
MPQPSPQPKSERIAGVPAEGQSLGADVRRARFGAQRAFGEFLQLVANANDGPPDARLLRAASEVDPTSGGFLVGPRWSDQLRESAYDASVLAQMVDIEEAERPDVKLPAVDETSRADGARWGGFVSYWAAESASVAGSWPRVKLLEFSGHKIIILVRCSRELLSDVSLLGGFISRGFAAEAGFKLDQAVLSGTGAGTPQGMLKSDCLITIAKEGGQAAASIVSENVKKMWSRLPAPCRRRAVWLCNEDAEGELENLGGASGPALYMPAGTGGNPYPLLKGRPVHVLEQSPPLGQVGDIALVDPTQYQIIDGGQRTALSLHSRFDNDEVVFKFTWRVDGKGIYSSPITPYSGSSTRSPFVALTAR